MNRKDIIGLFDDGVSTVYGWYEQGQEPKRPYRVLHYLDNPDFSADNLPYLPRSRWQLDLVTDKKSEAIEASTESALLARGIRFSKYEDLNDEAIVSRRIQVSYRFTTMGD